MSKLHIQFYLHNNRTHTAELAGAVELGRQMDEHERLNCLFPKAGKEGEDRIAFAPLEKIAISRRQIVVEPLGGPRLRLTNRDKHRHLVLTDGSIGPSVSREVRAPYQFEVGEYRFRIVDEADQGCGSFETNIGRSLPAAPMSAMMRSLGSDQSKQLIDWLKAITDVLQSAAHSADFFQQAAAAIVDLIGLDSGRVLLFEGGQWNIAASYSAQSADCSQLRHSFSHSILDEVRAEKRTKTLRDASNFQHLESLQEVETVVVSPIFNRRGDVIGALYGDRQRRDAPREFNVAGITEADKMLIETLAGGLGTGLARLEQEQAALSERVRFEQFFTPALARQLAEDPDLLDGRFAEVSLLFCDIRGFSTVSGQLGAAGTMDWINDVLGALSQCVLDCHGVLVDYTGDELFAMWGAPVEQPDHADLACRTAIAMFEALREVSDRWRDRIGGDTRVGIGINTGEARVGNTGSRHKFKYGALGSAVNLASRVQGATKYLRTKILITKKTRVRLSAEFAIRRLCTVKVVNIPEEVDLYELRPQPPAEFAELRKSYEEALQSFDSQQCEQAFGQLCTLLSRFSGDGPSLALLGRLVPVLDDPRKFSRVWELPGK